MIDRRYKNRSILVACFITLVMFGLTARLYCLHFGVGEFSFKKERIEEMRKLETELQVSRGKIIDRNGNALAIDVVKKTVCAAPDVLISNNTVNLAAMSLASALNMDTETLLLRLNQPGKKFVYVQGYGNAVEEDIASLIKNFKINGIFLRDVMMRSYPAESCAAHILGFVNLDLKRQGGAGIELYFDKYLRGVPGLLISELDGRRRELYDRRKLEIKPQPGADVVLTIDLYVQHIVETALQEAIAETEAIAGWAIVEKIKTGEILAMASYPTFDPNNFRTVNQEALRNRCIANLYEPGSTFKVLIISAALNEGIVHPEQIFDCESGKWVYQKKVLHDFHPYGNLTVADIIKKSSNIGAAKIALLLGNNRIYQYLKNFGIGRPTGIELPGEESGILKHVSSWNALSPTRIAIGHEVAVNALQILSAVCAIANDGMLMKPYIVSKIVAPDGRILFEQTPTRCGYAIRPDTAKLMRNLLKRVTEEGGTGTKARVEGYTVAGKTGTAQKILPTGGYSATLNISSFVGFLPADDPEIGIIVVLDEPKGAVRTGGYVCGPVFKAIAEKSVRYLDIPSENTNQFLVSKTEGANKQSF